MKIFVRKKQKNIDQKVKRRKQESAFWLYFISPKSRKMALDMNETEETIIRWSKRRLLFCMGFAVMGIILVITKLFGKLGFIAGLGLLLFSLLYYFIQNRSIVSQFKQYRFLQQVEFSKFTRILIPYLLNENNQSLYACLQKVDIRLGLMSKPTLNASQRGRKNPKTGKNQKHTLKYTRQEWMRRITVQFEVGKKEYKVMTLLSLYLKQLMLKIRDNSNDIQPYIEFANLASGSQEARTFMESLFYYSQASNDASVIKELSSMSNKQLFLVVDEVVRQKVKSISWIPQTMSMFVAIPLFGIMGSYVVHMFMIFLKQLH